MNIVFRVARQIYNYNTTAPGVASALMMNRETMRTRLGRHGVMFQELRSLVRFRMARKLIKQGKSNECVLHELGIESMNGINDIFRRHAGITLHQYREGIKQLSPELMPPAFTALYELDEV